ncbi:cytochrome P450 [Kitasatospora sp. NPDC093806]|uniref:cytochrome P450 family protein n=1 Tax=Kitasatospora sp. NPDC093806 TaxID=3155075 RepID=UPI00343EB58D
MENQQGLTPFRQSGRRGDPDPYPNYAWMREHCPVSLVAGGDGEPATWLVTAYELSRTVLGDARISADVRNSAYGAEEESSAFERNLQGMDPPEHARLRRLVSAAFSPRAVERYRPRIERICRETIAAFAGRGTADLVTEYSLIVPVAVIHDVLGVPEELQQPPEVCMEQFWRASIMQPTDRAAVAFLDDYLREVVAHKRRHPGDDVVTDLLAKLDAGELDSEDELRGMLYLIIGAGHATSVPFLGAGILRLMQHPEQLADVLADPALWQSSIEEILRYDSPSQAGANRYAREAMTIGDTEVAKGDAVLISLAAANRDPAQFPDPDRFDVRRPARSHLAFGQGTHFCLGAHLARAEGEIALRTLFETLPDLALTTPADQVPWALGPMLRGPGELPVTFTPRPTEIRPEGRR